MTAETLRSILAKKIRDSMASGAEMNHNDLRLIAMVLEADHAEMVDDVEGVTSIIRQLEAIERTANDLGTQIAIATGVRALRRLYKLASDKAAVGHG